MATTWNFRSEGLTVNFCPECGSLLELPKQIGNIECSMCKYSCTFAELDLGVQTIVTKSSKIAAPSSQLRRGALEDKETRATVERVCQVCNHTKMFYSTQQTRSMDEGATVFYECTRCGEMEKLNN